MRSCVVVHGLAGVLEEPQKVADLVGASRFSLAAVPGWFVTLLAIV